MVSGYLATRSPFAEPIPIEEQIAAGPAIVKVVENGVYLVLYVPHVSPDELDRGEERRICVRLVMPRVGAAKLARAIDDALVCDGLGIEQERDVDDRPLPTLMPQ